MQLNQAYQALGLPWAASKHEVRRAYRRLIKTWHPDRNTHPSAAVISARINLAYATLAAHEFAADSVENGEAVTETSVDPAPEYGCGPRIGPRRSRPAFHNLYLTIEQGAEGGIFEFTAITEDLCPCCEGFTTVTTEFPCEACAATGTLKSEEGESTCLDCQGTGVMLIRCSVCGGTGLGNPADFRFKAIIPKGVRDGELYRFRAVGKSSGDARFAAEAIVRVHVIHHALFGFDPFGRLLVTVPRAGIQGGRIMIPTLAGPKPLHVPSAHVREALIKGHGYPEKDGSRGELIVRFG